MIRSNTLTLVNTHLIHGQPGRVEQENPQVTKLEAKSLRPKSLLLAKLGRRRHSAKQCPLQVGNKHGSNGKGGATRGTGSGVTRTAARMLYCF